MKTFLSIVVASALTLTVTLAETSPARAGDRPGNAIGLRNGAPKPAKRYGVWYRPPGKTWCRYQDYETIAEARKMAAKLKKDRPDWEVEVRRYHD